MHPNTETAPLTTGPSDQAPDKGSVVPSIRAVEGPDIMACAKWLQSVHGCFLFAVDHPGALRCAGAHRPERPCDGKRGKHPCGRWSREATQDPDVIRAAFSRGLRNIGIACKPSGLLVVDEDRPGSFVEYAESIGQDLPVTFTVVTAQGRHFYYRPPAGVLLGNGRGALEGRGIDIRGGGAGYGGYVVGPGSVHASGVVYTPVDSAAPIVAAPGWLVEALRQPVAAACPDLPGVVRDLSAYARQALQGERERVADAVHPGRNQALNKAAYNLGRLVGSGVLPEELVTDELYRVASVHFGPPPEGLTPAETRDTIRSGLLAGMRRPRTVTTRTR